MTLFRSIKGMFALHAAVLLLLVVATSLHIIQFRYPRVVENDPLLSPVRVRSVTGNTLVLEDGRTFQVDSNNPLDEVIQSSEFWVDLESQGDDSHVEIFAKRRLIFMCGTPWAGLIEIPLIADDIPINDRVHIGRGTIVAPKPTRSMVHP